MTEIPRQMLGQSDLEVSRLCFGTYRFYAKDPSLAAPLIGEAFESGINFFDTSDNYQVAEQAIGKALHEGALIRDEVVIATKTGLATTYEEHLEFERRGVQADKSPSRIRKQIEVSLGTMGIEAVDLYQVHGYDNVSGPAELADTMGLLVQEGKIRYWGVTGYNHPTEISELLVACDDNNLQRPITVQNGFNLINRYSGRALQTATDESMGGMAYSPLDASRLTQPSVMRAVTEAERNEEEGFEQTLTSALSELDKYASSRGHNIQRLGISWLLNIPNLIPIIGAYKSQHLQDLVYATEWQLGPNDLAFVDQVLQRVKEDS